MSEKPLVSVIVPTYNRPDFLRRTMESILTQTYRDIELIVISNGISPVNEQTVTAFGDARVRYADQDNSGGPSAPRNHGIRLARGKYIAVCDDDDLWLPEKLAKQVAALEDRPECGVCYTDAVSFDETGREWREQGDGRTACFKSLLYRNTVPLSSVMVRADLVRARGGYHEGPEVGDSEDYEFILRCSYFTPFLYIPEILVRYWSGMNRTTATASHMKIANIIAYFRDVMGCYRVFSAACRVPVLVFARPALFHAGHCLKQALYIFLKDRGVLKSKVCHECSS